MDTLKKPQDGATAPNQAARPVTTAAATPPPPTPLTAKRTAATARAAQRLAKLQEQLRAARQYEQDAQDRQAQIVGYAVLEEFARAPEFRKQIVELLRRAVTRPADRTNIAPLLSGGKS